METARTPESEQARAALTAALGGGYELRALLGRGGFGEVYSAYDLRLKREVAVKALRADLLLSAGLLERFRREAEAAARLRHPHIIPIYAVGEEHGVAWFTMPLVHGESLRTILERGALPIPDARRILREAASALMAAHAAGIVHRDIKPDNIMLEGPEHRVLLMDFGIAKAMADTEAGLTGSGFIVGTPQFMSPEQAVGEKNIDHRSDIYSLGVVAYQMLAGRPPFEGETPQALIVQHLTAEPAPLAAARPDVPPALADVIMRCLAKKPEERWDSAESLLRALDPDAVVTPTQATIPIVPRAVSRRGPRAAIIAAVILLALVAVLAGKLFGPRPTATPSVAVLYFDNLSHDTNDVYLAEGLSNEVASRLGALGRLQVKSMNAVRRVQQSAAVGDYSALARALAVRYVVEGSVQHAGERVRVSVSLVNASDGFTAWDSLFDRATMDMLALQEEIARAVATSISGRLLPQDRARLAARPTDNAAAYDHFLRANHYLAQRGPAPLERAIGEYNAAVGLDGAFTQARARVALSYAVALWWGWRMQGLAPDSMLARGLAAADTILSHDSSVADAWTARGFLLTFKYPRSYDGVEDAFRRSLALDSGNAETWQQYAWVLSTTGRDSAAEAAYRRAIAIDRERPISYSAIAWHCIYLARRYPPAVAAVDTAIQLDSTAYYAYQVRAIVHLALSDTAAARRDAEAAVRFGPPGSTQGEGPMAMVDAAEGRATAGRERVARMIRALPDPSHPAFTDAYYIAGALIALGEKAAAIQFLERAQPRGAALWFATRFPTFDAIRSDPRFVRVVTDSRPPDVPR